VNRRRWVAGLAGLAVLAGLGLAPPVQQTEAAWVDPENATATFQALTVPAPEPWGTPSCTARTVLLVGGETVIRWRVPAGASGYTSADLEYARDVGGVLNPVLSSLLGTQTTTGTTSAYTTTFSGGLLTNALGGDLRFAMRLKGPGGWSSSWLVAYATFPALAGTGTCTLSVVSS